VNLKITRRDAFFGAIAASICNRNVQPAYGSAPHAGTAVNLKVPAGACDCHFHIFGDPRQFPFSASRTYTPELATVSDSLAVHRALHMDSLVVVNSLVYGADNSCMLDALQRLGHRARGIALIDDTTSEAELGTLAGAGVRGIRLNFVNFGITDAGILRQRFLSAIHRVARRNWQIQIYTNLPGVEALASEVLNAPVAVVFDHFADAKASLGVVQAGFAVLLDLLRSGKAYVKRSAAYRVSQQSPDYPDVAPLAQALVAANPERVLWGTDWPHPAASPVPGRGTTDLAPFLQIDDGRLLNQLPIWAPTAQLRRKILVENPAKLYGF